MPARHDRGARPGARPGGRRGRERGGVGLRRAVGGLLVAAALAGCGAAAAGTAAPTGTAARATAVSGPSSGTPSGAPSAQRPPSPTPSAAPSGSPVASPSATVTLPGGGADGALVVVVLDDQSGMHAGLRAATADELRRGSLALGPDADAGLVQLGSNRLLVTWVGTVCETGYMLTATSGRVVVIAPAPRQACDLGRYTFAAVIAFGEAVRAGSWKADLRRGAVR